jgi:hypothetical protein
VPRRSHRSLSRTLLKGGLVIALLAGAAYGLTLIQGPSFDFSTPGRRHLRQIPIARAQACSQVEAIHAQLSAFAESYTAASFGIDAKTLNEVVRGAGASPTSGAPEPSAIQRPSWVVVESEIDDAAQRLDAALVNGMPYFPSRIRTQLATIRSSIAEGRRQLATVHDASAFKSLTRRPFERGQLHAGYASDLVGRQCRVRLGA